MLCINRYAIARQEQVLLIIVMGVVYSISSYFYPSTAPKLSEHLIRTRSQKLVLYIRQAQYRLQQQTIKEEQDLLALITGNKLLRSQGAERVRI